MKTSLLRFSINTWQHLYSLQQAVQQTNNLSGNQLLVEGRIRNERLFDRRDMPIRLTFSASGSPTYQYITDNQLILGKLLRHESLEADILVNPQVFAELKKNLLEYIGIEGIHIVVTLGIILPDNDWLAGKSADIVQLDYAMKGDGG